MTLTLEKVKAQVETGLPDDALQLLIDAVEADIMRLGGVSFPLKFSGSLLDIYAVSTGGAGTALSRSYFGNFPAIGNPLIKTTATALVEVSYTLAGLNSGAVTINVDGDGTDDSETLSSLADAALRGLSFYVVTSDGRLELRFEAAEAADASTPDRVQWAVATAGQAAARTLLKEVAEHERVRFVMARPFASLIMPVADWRAALDRIAVSCLRIAVTDEGVASYMERGADTQQALSYLSYSTEYRARLNEVLSLTGGWFV